MAKKLNLKKKEIVPSDARSFARDFMGKNKSYDDVREDDVVSIIKKFGEYISAKYNETPPDEKIVYPLGLNIPTGLIEIYGRTDSGKTSLAIWIAKWFISNDIATMYVDADNKITPGLLPTSSLITYSPGRSNTPDVIRKLISQKTVGAIIVDTIYSLSRYENFLKHTVKKAREYGLYVIMINQSRSWRYGEYSAGSDVVDNVSRRRYFVSKFTRRGSNYYMFLKEEAHPELAHRIVFTLKENNSLSLLDYNVGESGLAYARMKGDAVKIGRNYIIKDKEYTRKQAMKHMEKVIINKDWVPK